MTNLQNYDVTIRVIAQDVETAIATAKDDCIKLQANVVNVEPTIEKIVYIDPRKGQHDYTGEDYE